MSIFGREEKAILKAMGYTPTKEIISLQGFSFPQVVSKRAQREIGCTSDQMELVEIALLDYFLEVKLNRDVPMVDKNADVLWHTFLLDTKAYMRFCSMHIGFYVHHIPYITDKEVKSPDKFDEEDRLDRIIKHDPLYFNGRRKNALDRHNDDDINTFLPMYALINSEDDIEYRTTPSEPVRESSMGHHSEPERVATPAWDKHDTGFGSFGGGYHGSRDNNGSDASDIGGGYSGGSSSSGSSSSSCGSSCGSSD